MEVPSAVTRNATMILEKNWSLKLCFVAKYTTKRRGDITKIEQASSYMHKKEQPPYNTITLNKQTLDHFFALVGMIWNTAINRIKLE